jgi:hypothetical protein
LLVFTIPLATTTETISSTSANILISFICIMLVHRLQDSGSSPYVRGQSTRACVRHCLLNDLKIYRKPLRYLTLFRYSWDVQNLSDITGRI